MLSACRRAWPWHPILALTDVQSSVSNAKRTEAQPPAVIVTKLKLKDKISTMDLSNTHSRAMNGVIRPTRSAWLTFDEIEVSDNARPYNASDVVEVAKSIREIGLLTPLSVVERDGRFVLVAGRHRLEALKVVGAEKFPAASWT